EVSFKLLCSENSRAGVGIFEQFTVDPTDIGVYRRYVPWLVDDLELVGCGVDKPVWNGKRDSTSPCVIAQVCLEYLPGAHFCHSYNLYPFAAGIEEIGLAVS